MTSEKDLNNVTKDLQKRSNREFKDKNTYKKNPKYKGKTPERGKGKLQGPFSLWDSLEGKDLNKKLRSNSRIKGKGLNKVKNHKDSYKGPKRSLDLETQKFFHKYRGSRKMGLLPSTVYNLYPTPPYSRAPSYVNTPAKNSNDKGKFSKYLNNFLKGSKLSETLSDSSRKNLKSLNKRIYRKGVSHLNEKPYLTKGLFSFSQEQLIEDAKKLKVRLADTSFGNLDSYYENKKARGANKKILRAKKGSSLASLLVELEKKPSIRSSARKSFIRNKIRFLKRVSAMQGHDRMPLELKGVLKMAGLKKFGRKAIQGSTLGRIKAPSISRGVHFSNPKGKIIRFKGWPFLYGNVKKKIQDFKGWAREWEERPKNWSRRIRNWEKNIKVWNPAGGKKSTLELGSNLGNLKKPYIPYYLRRKFYQVPSDPISLGYHEKCFNGGLKRYRKYNKKSLNRAKLWRKLRTNTLEDLKGNIITNEESLKGILRRKKSLSPTELFIHVRKQSRVAVKMRRKGKNYNYHKLQRLRKERAYLRRGIPKKRIGIVHINAGLKNTIISLSDLDKNVRAWVSNGSVGFKRKKRKSPYASYVAGQTIGQKAFELGYRGVVVYLKGVGKGRHNSCRGLATTRLKILRLKDRIRLPHNGCRLRKKRRV